MSFIPYNATLLAVALSAASALVAAAVNLPVLALQGLHTYIHPNNVAGGAAIRRPEAPAGDPVRRRRRRSSSAFDESEAQLLRLRLADSHLQTRLLFPQYRAAVLSAAFALPLLASRLPAAGLAAAAAVLFSCHLIFSLLKAALDRSASKKSDKQLSLLSGFLGFLSALLITCFPKSSTVFEFEFRLTTADSLPSKITASAIAGFLAGVLFVPASRAARAFWLGTDQLRWNLSVVSCGPTGRILIHTATLSNVAAVMLWIKPVAALVLAGDEGCIRVWALLASAVSHILVLRPHLQMYLNEAVLCWYQRLHTSREPDLDYGRAKVFLHNHYICLVVLQLIAPPVLVLLLLGLSMMRGNLFIGAPECFSVLVKNTGLFLAWWIMLVWSIVTMSSLALYRCGFLFVL